ncbi:hypothetical protein ACLB1T_09115 [Escherichia coli]
MQVMRLAQNAQQDDFDHLATLLKVRNHQNRRTADLTVQER